MSAHPHRAPRRTSLPPADAARAGPMYARDRHHPRVPASAPFRATHQRVRSSPARPAVFAPPSAPWAADARHALHRLRSPDAPRTSRQCRLPSFRDAFPDAEDDDDALPALHLPPLSDFDVPADSEADPAWDDDVMEDAYDEEEDEDEASPARSPSARRFSLSDERGRPPPTTARSAPARCFPRAPPKEDDLSLVAALLELRRSVAPRPVQPSRGRSELSCPSLSPASSALPSSSAFPSPTSSLASPPIIKAEDVLPALAISPKAESPSPEPKIHARPTPPSAPAAECIPHPAAALEPTSPSEPSPALAPLSPTPAADPLPSPSDPPMVSDSAADPTPAAAEHAVSAITHEAPAAVTIAHEASAEHAAAPAIQHEAPASFPREAACPSPLLAGALRGAHEAPPTLERSGDGLDAAVEDGLVPLDGPILGDTADELKLDDLPAAGTAPEDEQAAAAPTAEPATLVEPMLCDGPVPEHEPMLEDLPMAEDLPAAGAAPEDGRAASASAVLEDRQPPLVDLDWALEDVAIERGLTPPPRLREEQPALASMLEGGPLALTEKDVQDLPVLDIARAPSPVPIVEDEHIRSSPAPEPLRQTSRLPSPEVVTARSTSSPRQLSPPAQTMKACQPSLEIEMSAPELDELLVLSTRSPSPPVSTSHQSSPAPARPASPLSAWFDAQVDDDGDMSMTAGPSRPATPPRLASVRIEAKLTPTHSSPLSTPSSSRHASPAADDHALGPVPVAKTKRKSLAPGGAGPARKKRRPSNADVDADAAPVAKSKSRSRKKKAADMPADAPPLRAVSPCATLPADRPYTAPELAGLLIETLALTRASSLTLPELTAALVRTHPALGGPALAGDCTAVLAAGEARSGVFGAVAPPAGGGRHVQRRWFYVPERDADRGRAAAIGAAMPARRAEARRPKRYYWRPLGKISRWDAEEAL